MNWRNTAIEELRSYSKICEAEKSLRERLEALEARLTSTRGASLSAVPTHGGGSHYEDMMLDTIAERDAVAGELTFTSKKRKLIERGLAALDDDERTVINKFYLKREPGYIDALCETLNVEVAQIYRIKNRALYHYALAVYGAGNMMTK